VKFVFDLVALVVGMGVGVDLLVATFFEALLGGVCLNFSTLLWIRFQKIQKLDCPKSEKLRSSSKGASTSHFLSHLIFGSPES
jgi:hypothetical protein